MSPQDAPAPAQCDGKRGPDREPDGRFRAGHGLGGRPRGLDLRRIAEERAEAAGVDVVGELWAALLALLRQAAGGDVQAAKLVFDRLCAPADDMQSGLSIVVQTGVPQADPDLVAQIQRPTIAEPRRPDPLPDRATESLEHAARRGDRHAIEELARQQSRGSIPPPMSGSRPGRISTGIGEAFAYDPMETER